MANPHDKLMREMGERSPELGSFPLVFGQRNPREAGEKTKTMHFGGNVETWKL